LPSTTNRGFHAVPSAFDRVHRVPTGLARGWSSLGFQNGVHAVGPDKIPQAPLRCGRGSAGRSYVEGRVRRIRLRR
jgi:hypothetical protein